MLVIIKLDGIQSQDSLSGAQRHANTSLMANVHDEPDTTLLTVDLTRIIHQMAFNPSNESEPSVAVHHI